MKDQLRADDCFLTLGTTKKQTPIETEYYAIDHDYPLETAKLVKENGGTSVFVVTGVGANSGSKFFYVRSKGELERDLIALGYKHTHIFQPSMLLGHRAEDRPLEKVFQGLSSLLNPLLIGTANRFRGIEGKVVAKAMRRAAHEPSAAVNTYHWAEMMKLASDA